MATRIPLHPSYKENLKLQKRLNLSIVELGLSPRATSCMEEFGISTIGHLLRYRREELLAIPNFGEKTLSEVYQALTRMGFTKQRLLGETAAEKSSCTTK